MTRSSLSPNDSSLSSLKRSRTSKRPNQSNELSKYIPKSVGLIEDPQTALPRIAKDPRLTAEIDTIVQQLPTQHDLHIGDARTMEFLSDNSVHLIVTSPPYWTLKKYRDSDGQMGDIENYEEFLTELDRVWSHCYRALVPGGRLI